MEIRAAPRMVPLFMNSFNPIPAPDSIRSDIAEIVRMIDAVSGQIQKFLLPHEVEP